MKFVRTSLFDDVFSVPEMVNNILQNSLSTPSWTGMTYNQPTMALNVYEDNTNYYVMGLVPGIEPDKLDLSVKENVLTIKGEYQVAKRLPTQTEGEGENTKPEYKILLAEIPQGQLYRQIKFPIAFDFDKIEAHLDNGLLKLVVPKAERNQVKKITVHASNSQLSTSAERPQIEASKS